MNTEIEALEPEVVGQELAKVERSSGLAEERALALRGEFAEYYNTIGKLRETAMMVTKVDDPMHQKLARDVRLGLRKVRCEVENVRKSLKADSLSRGKAIDGFANVLKYLCEPIESKLLEIEQYAERQEAERVANEAAAKEAKLIILGLDEFQVAKYNLCFMDDATFDAVLVIEKERIANEAEASRKAEADRIALEKAEADERERVRKENKRLKAEAVEREAEVAAEAAKIEAERAKERKVAAEKQRKLEAEAKTEREAREKVERDAAAVKAKKAAELKAEQAAKAKAERAPDKEKIKAFAAELLDLQLPDVTTGAAHDVMIEISQKRDGFACWIEKQVETL